MAKSPSPCGVTTLDSGGRAEPRSSCRSNTLDPRSYRAHDVPRPDGPDSRRISLRLRRGSAPSRAQSTTVTGFPYPAPEEMA